MLLRPATQTSETLKLPGRRLRRHSLTILELFTKPDLTVRKDRDAAERSTVDKHLLSSSVNYHYIRLRHATVIRQSEKNVQVQFPKLYSATNLIVEFRAVSVYVKVFRVDDRITIQVLYSELENADTLQ